MRIRVARTRGGTGFSLLEVLVALSILAVIGLSVMQVFMYTERAGITAREMTMEGVLAAEKLDQMRSLTWAYDATGAAVDDGEADVTADAESPSGGVGLKISPADALGRNIDGYCDFLDGSGRSLGGGTIPPRGTAFVRRWLVRPLAAAPGQALVVQVRLTSRTAANRAGGGADDLVVTTVRSRLAR